ncbi:MAG TPA: hypothetical protein VEY09_15215, partial [Pyrinomonadaceae bacterium]|nr:hypothetical protein [Pyrinomonadaceae bacterium]
MLFVESRERGRIVPEAERPRLLGALARAGFAPLAHTTRRRAVELALGPAAHARPDLIARLEGRLAPRPDGVAPLHPGDLFCFPDHVLYLVFREGGFRAGLVHAAGFERGGVRLEEFCRAVEVALAPHDFGAGAAEGHANFNASDVDDGSAALNASGAGPEPFGSGAVVVSPAQTRLPSAAAFDAAFDGTDAETRQRLAAAAALEDDGVRGLLRRLRDVGAGPSGDADLPAPPDGFTVGRLVEAGLLRRDVRVSCRRTGHALLDLPAADSLALVTASRARCGLCAAPVADEVIAETLNPTELAAALLDGAAWLRDRVLGVLASLGLAPRTVSAGEVSEHGEACLLAEVCGEQFLFFVRDGDLTAEATRRAVARASDTNAAHLFAVSTGAVEDGARMRLYEFSWRRAREGRDLGVTILEGLGRARAEIGRALDA